MLDACKEYRGAAGPDFVVSAAEGDTSVEDGVFNCAVPVYERLTA